MIDFCKFCDFYPCGRPQILSESGSDNDRPSAEKPQLRSHCTKQTCVSRSTATKKSCAHLRPGSQPYCSELQHTAISFSTCLTKIREKPIDLDCDENGYINESFPFIRNISNIVAHPANSTRLFDFNHTQRKHFSACVTSYPQSL